jgi:hypothetical protein
MEKQVFVPSPTPFRPKLGDFAVIPISGEVGKLIKIGEWLDGDGFKNYEHAEVYVGNMAKDTAPLSLGYTLGAYPGGAMLKPVPVDQSGWLWSSGKIQLTDIQRLAVTMTALRCQGIPYSAADYFALAGHRLKIPMPGLKEYIASTDQMICSQLVDYCYLKAGVHLFNDGRWPGYVTPEDLANVLLG